MHTRRSFLGAGAIGAAGAAAFLAGSRFAFAAPAVPADLTLPTGADTLGQGTFSLFEQSDLNFQTLIALGGAGINSQVGEVTTVVAQAGAAPGGATYQSLFDAFVAQGNRLEQAAADAAKAKQTVTARDRYLRAAQYYNQALFWVLGTSTPDREEDVYLAMDAAFHESAKRQAPAWEPLTIPYGKQDLHGWFLRAPGATGKRPTLIMNNGSDGQNVDMLPQGGAAALARGWNVVLFEGPGQGRALFVDQMPFTPDWAGVITPVVDTVLKRNDVDPKKVALIGVSFGGSLVMRAAAEEHRLAAVVSDPGSVDEYAAFPSTLRDVAAKGDAQTVNATWANLIIPGSTPQETFQLKKRLEIFATDALAQARTGQVPTDWYGLSRKIQEFTLGDLTDKVRTPTLVIDYELEAFYPGQAKQLYDALPGKKEYVEFTTVEGAQYHDAPIGSQWHGEVVMDKLNALVA
ncbi:MAG: alpha/beta hydrolase [Acidimicrobiia bacterium]